MSRTPKYFSRHRNFSLDISRKREYYTSQQGRESKTKKEKQNEQLTKNSMVPIDVFYVGPGSHHAEEFLRCLATVAGGEYQHTTLAEAPQLTKKIAVKLLTA